MNRLRKIAILASALIVAALAPAGGAESERREMIAYDSGSGVHVMDVVWIEVAGVPESRPLAGERKVSIEIADESGRPVAGVVHQGGADLGEICGQTEAPLRLVSRKSVHVHIYAGPACEGVSAPTSGTVTFTFTR
ncbi:MAG: hypothetical protein M3279_01295 [Actinomycetota bacterium]|nr:hypothetical protein [Actinomycetota bacterium]